MDNGGEIHMNGISEKLLNLRKEKGVTQEEVAAKLGVSPQSVSKWENGISYPDISLLPLISDYYGVSIDYLLGKDDAKNRVSPNTLVHIQVKEPGEDEVNLKLPYNLVKSFLGKGRHLGTEKSDQIFGPMELGNAVKEGVRGRVLEIKEDDGTTITIDIE